MKILGLALSIVTFAATSTALAQGVDELGPYGGLENAGRSPKAQRLAIEARFGPYKPRVDSEVAGSPYEDTFGDGHRFFFGAEVDWQVFRVPQVLSLGPGFSWAYTRATADAPLSDGSGRSAQTTSLSIMPMTVEAVLRI